MVFRRGAWTGGLGGRSSGCGKGRSDSVEGKRPRDGARADGLGRGSGGEGCSAKWNHNRVELVEL